MKIKAPKPWQITVILVMAFVLAIVGSVLAVYFTTGFGAQTTYPESITLEVDAKDNGLGQYEVDKDFSFVVNTETEGVTEKEVRLSFPNNTQVYKGDDIGAGNISDGRIIIPEKAVLGQTIPVKLYDKYEYTASDGSKFYSYKAGVSTIEIRSANSTDEHSEIEVAVDVPVHEIVLRLANTSLPKDDPNRFFEMKDGKIVVAQGSNIEVVPEFYPAESKYLFSDGLNSKVAEANKRLRSVFLRSGNANDVAFSYNDGDPYFTAREITAENALEMIEGFAFTNANDQLLFEQSEYSGETLYNDAFSWFANDDIESVNAIANFVIQESTIDTFSINNNTSSNHMQMTVNKPFRLFANGSSNALGLTIVDNTKQITTSVYGNVGLKIISVKDLQGRELITGGATADNFVTVEGAKEGLKSIEGYTLMNVAVKDLNNAYFTLSTNSEYTIVAKVVLFEQKTKGNYTIFKNKNGEEAYGEVYLDSREGVSSPVTWAEGKNQAIDIKILYENDKLKLTSYSLKDMVNIPAENAYQDYIFFVYPKGLLPSGKSMSDYVEIAPDGSGIYTFANDRLYPLSGDSLDVKDALDFNLVFATVRTDANGDRYQNSDGTFIIDQYSQPISVTVSKSLRSPEKIVFMATGGFNYSLNGMNLHVIPTKTEKAVRLDITFREGDLALFQEEYGKGNIEIYASEDHDGNIKSNILTLNGDPVYDEASRTATFTFDVGMGNPDLADYGKDYFITVNYFDSFAHNIWSAADSNNGGLDESSDSIRVYKQVVKTITNGEIADGNLSVVQKVTADDDNSLSITLNGQIVANWEAFDEKMAATTMVDIYNQPFSAPGYTIVTNSDVITPSPDGKSIRVATSGNASTQVEVCANGSDAKFTFRVEAQSIGVQRIEVNGIDMTQNPSYVVPGLKDTELKFKDVGADNLFKIILADNSVYTRYHVNFISDIDSDLQEMLDIINEEENPQFIKSFTLKNSFGKEVILPLHVFNDSNNVDFTFTLRLTPAVQFYENGLNEIDYSSDLTSVKGKGNDKTYVYAEYDLPFTEKFKYSELSGIGSGTWNAANFEPQYVSGDVTWNKDNKTLKFGEVYTEESKTITLYALSNNNGGGNEYGFKYELSLVVCPNFELSVTKSFSMIEFEKTEPNLRLGDYVSLKRVTGEHEIISLDGVTYAAEDGSSIKIEKTIAGDGFNVAFNKTLNLGFGEKSALTTINLLYEGDVIASCKLRLDCGINSETLQSSGNTWLANLVRYGGIQRVLISAAVGARFNTISLSEDYDSNLSVYLLSNDKNYTVSQSNGDLMFNNVSEPINVGTDFYLNICIGKSASDNKTTYVTLLLPYIYSRVGENFAIYNNDYYTNNKYLEENDTNLANVADLEALLGETDSSAEVYGGEKYYLIAPETLTFGGKTYYYEFSESGIKLAEAKDGLAEAEASETVGGYTITFETFDRKNGTKKVLKSFAATKDDDVYKIQVLTGLSKEDFGSIQISFANNNHEYLTVNETSGELTVANFVGKSGEAVKSAVAITFKSADSQYLITQHFNLDIRPNNIDGGESKLQDVVYPNNGTVEFAETTDNTFELDFAAKIPENAINNGQYRFPDKLNNGTAVNATMAVSHVYVAGVENSNAVNARLEGTKLIVTGVQNVKDIEIILTRTFTDVYTMGGEHATQEYDILLNETSGKEYYVVVNNASGTGIDEDALVKDSDGNYTLTLSRDALGNDITLSTTTRVRTSRGEADAVEQTTISSTLAADKPEDSTTTDNLQDISNTSFKFKIEGFVNIGFTFDLHFAVRGRSVSTTIHVIVPSTVDISLENDLDLTGGRSYTSDNLVAVGSEYAEHVVINSIEVVEGRGFDINAPENKFWSTTARTEGEAKEPDGSDAADDGADDDAPAEPPTPTPAQIEFYHMIESRDIKFKFTYTYTIDKKIYTGYYITDFTTVGANVAITNKVALGEISKKAETTTIEKNLSDEIITGVTTFDATKWSSRVNSSQFATATVNYTDGKVTVTPNYVSKTEIADFTITFIYTNGSYTFEKTASFTLTVNPAARLEVHYPNPEGASETLERESIKAGEEYESFLTGKALFANQNRFTDSIGENPIITSGITAKVVSISQGVTLKKKDNSSFVNVDTTIAADDTIKAELTNVDNGTITLEVTYKGSVQRYELFVTNNWITSKINKTNHYNGSTETETIYADTLTETGMFGSERLLEINVSAQAQVDTTYYIYLIEGESGTLLNSFKLTSELRQAGVMYIDWGGNVDASRLKEPTSKLEFRGKDGTVYSDFTVTRLAGRIEFFYSTGDGSSVRIDGDKISFTSNDVDKTTTGNATYALTPALDGEDNHVSAITYKISRQLDFMVENNYTKENGIIAADVVVGESEKIKFVDTAGLKRASNGEIITAEEVKRSKITMRLNVVNVASDKNDWLSVTGGNGKFFKFRTSATEGEQYDYLNTFGIEVEGDDGKKYPYDFYFYALGCANDGDYVLVQLIYSCNQVQSAEYYFAYHIIPGYNVKIDGKVVATAGNVYSNSVTNGAGTPYESNGKTTDTDVLLPLTGDDGLIKVNLTHHNPNTERSQAFKITITENDEALYNSSDNMAKLTTYVSADDGAVGTWAWPLSPSSTPNVYSWHSAQKYNASSTNKAVLRWTGTAAFGEKRYKAVLTDQYGYKIDFYFTLAPTERQNPKADLRSDTVFTEGDSFDVGAIYDNIDITNVDGYTATTTFAKTPPISDETLKKLFVEDIAGAYGYTTSVTGPVAKSAIKGSNIDEYFGNTQSFFKVKINSIKFKFDDSTAENAGGSTGQVLATDSSLKYATVENDNVTFISDSNAYRNMDKTFTVPTMPGWIYGGGNSANITIVVELRYANSETDYETYAVQFDAIINKHSNISQEKHVVVDGTEFNPAEYIGVGAEKANPAAVYDDTLAVTIPRGAQVRLGVKLGEKEIYPFTTAPLGNGGSLGRAETRYNFSLSRMSLDYLKDPSNKSIKLRLESTLPEACVTFGGTSYKANTKIITIGDNTFKLGDNGSISDDGTITYPTLTKIAGGNVTAANTGDVYTITETVGAISTSKTYNARMDSIGASEYRLTLTPTDVNDSNVYASVFAHIQGNGIEHTIAVSNLTNEVLYLEDNGVDFVGNKDSGQYHLVTKTYVVQVGGEANVKYYLHSQNFFVTRAYTYFDDGAGLAQQLHISKYFEQDNQYVVQQTNWTEKTKIYKAKDNDTKDGVAQGEENSLDEALINKHVYAKVTDEVGNPTAATIEDGVLKINKQNYTPGENQYLQIRLYVKVSGGPGKSSDKQWQTDEGKDFEIGTYMVVLDAAEVTSGNLITLSNYLPSAEAYFNNSFNVADLSEGQAIFFTLNGKDGSDLRTDTISANSNYQLAANSTQAATIFGSGFSIQALSSTSGAKIVYNGTTMTLNVRVLRMDNGDLYLVGYEYTPPVTSEAGEVTEQAKSFSDFDFTSTFPALIKISDDGAFGEAISITKVEEVVEGEAAADDEGEGEGDGGEKVVTYYYDLGDDIHVTVENADTATDWSDLLFRYEHEGTKLARIQYTFTPWSVAQEKGAETFPENANKQGLEFKELTSITTDTITTSEESIDRYYVLKNGTTYTPITKTYTVKQSP